MEFRDKMIFLMDVTRTSNKTLAMAINVDPSMISLIRTGRRGKPRNELHLHAMASYFSMRCHNQYTDELIARELSKINIIYDPSREDFSDLLFDWLSGRRQIPDALFKPLTVSLNRGIPISEEDPHSWRAGSSSNIYYGDTGKLDAMRSFYQYCLSMSTPSTIYLTSDENSEWYLHSPGLWQEMQKWKFELAEKGFHFVQILPPPGPGFFYSTLMHWMPIYTSSEIDVYFYPRYRDMLYRHTMFIVPNGIAMLSTSLASDRETAYTVLSTDAEFIASNLEIFKCYKAACQKTMVRHQDPEYMQNALRKFMELGGGKIQKNASLSTGTLPEELITDYLKAFPRSKKMKASVEKNYLNFLMQEDLQRKENTTIDLCPVASPYLVAKGEVPVFLPGFSPDHMVYYTPETYRKHLLKIIKLMKEEENYYFVPLPYEASFDNIIFLRPQKRALMFRCTTPVSVFEITQSEMISPFYLYLMEIAERNSYMNKTDIIARLERLAEDLEHYI